MNELHGKLLHMRELLQNLTKLNQEESRCKNQMKSMEVTSTYEPRKLSVKLILIGAVILIVLFSGTFTRFKENLQDAIEYDKIDDKFQWTMNHHDDNLEYPGYEEDPTIFTTTLFKTLAPLTFKIVLALVLLGGYTAKVHKENKTGRERIEQINANVIRQNQERVQRNQQLSIEIEGIQKKKKLLCLELSKNAQEWFPKDYSYLSAVNYFINLVENHMANTIQEAVKLYLDDIRYRAINGKLAKVSDGIKIMINNQEIMISRQEEMIRQEILTSFTYYNVHR